MFFHSKNEVICSQDYIIVIIYITQVPVRTWRLWKLQNKKGQTRPGLPKIFKTYCQNHCILCNIFSGNQSLTIRLTETLDNATGFLEVFDGVSSWGSICALSWGQTEANLACRYLGFSSAKSFRRKPASRDTVGYIAQAACFQELSFEKCVFGAWNKPYYRSCSFSGVAGVTCSGRPTCLNILYQFSLESGTSYNVGYNNKIKGALELTHPPPLPDQN